jgi:hypothetical protein
MVIFNSYVKLPEGRFAEENHQTNIFLVAPFLVDKQWDNAMPITDSEKSGYPHYSLHPIPFLEVHTWIIHG